MERIDQLIADYFDGQLTVHETQELAQRLEQDARLRQLFLDLYREHRLLIADHQPASEAEFSAAVLAELRSDQTDFVHGVMRNLGARAATADIAPLPASASWRPGPRPSLVERWTARWLLRFPQPAWIAMAACLLFVAGFTLFLIVRPEPVRAWVWKTDHAVVVQRGKARIPVTSGFILRSGDILQTAAEAAATVAYFGEKTEVNLEGNTALKLTAARKGKRLELDRGLVEATVTRQRPGHPMILATAQARATVLGTRFSLAARTASTWLTVSEGSVELTRLADRQSVRVGLGEWAVAARGVDLVSRSLEGDVLAGSPVPVKIALFSVYPEDEDWFTSPTSVQQRHPLGWSLQPFKVPSVEGSVLVEAVVRIDGVAPGYVMATEGWGFGLGLRCEGEEQPFSLRTLQQSPGVGVLEFSDRRTTHLNPVPLPHPATGDYQLKVELDRPRGGPAMARGKLWRQFEPEPAQWTVVTAHECRGPLAEVALSTLNCACTFAQFKLSLIE